jgi:hypothetical protein
MDRQDVESGTRLLGRLARLRELLRDEAGAPVQRAREAVRRPHEADEGGPAVDRGSAHRRRARCEPLSWRKPQRVFVNSMSDLFHEDVPDEFIDQVFA